MIEILSSAALSTVQDQGRDGYLRYGVGTSGAMDRIALPLLSKFPYSLSESVFWRTPRLP